MPPNANSWIRSCNVYTTPPLRQFLRASRGQNEMTKINNHEHRSGMQTLFASAATRPRTRTFQAPPTR